MYAITSRIQIQVKEVTYCNVSFSGKKQTKTNEWKLPDDMERHVKTYFLECIPKNV